MAKFLDNYKTNATNRTQEGPCKEEQKKATLYQDCLLECV